jgi:nucleotide-binding universal stress UspA family protein
MYDTILWATDGSPVSDGALAEAVRLLQPGGQLIAFHCDERLVGGRLGSVPLVVDECDRSAKLHAQVDALRADGVDARLEIEVTPHHVVGEIAKAAEHYNADAIVCGTRGFGVAGGVIAGSVAMRLPHVAPCPVVVVSERAARRAARGELGAHLATVATHVGAGR